MKLPPLEKIYEAWSAAAANRVAMPDQADAPTGQAEVRSSNNEKTYKVAWDGNVYAANDNATWWQGYPGYPILAVLMLQGKLPYPREMAALFASVDWHRHNKGARGDYAKALANVEEDLGLSEAESEKIKSLAADSLQKLSALDLQIGRSLKKKAGQDGKK